MAIRQEPSAAGKSGAAARLISDSGFAAYRNGFGITEVAQGLIGGKKTWILKIQPNCDNLADWLPCTCFESQDGFSLLPNVNVRARHIPPAPDGQLIEVYMFTDAGVPFGVEEMGPGDYVLFHLEEPGRDFQTTAPT